MNDTLVKKYYIDFRVQAMYVHISGFFVEVALYIN